jgi:hypothetical protein
MMETASSAAIAAPERARRDRDLSSCVWDGVSFSVMVGMGEAYVPAFALAMGLGEVVAGLIATLPMLAGALFQLVTPLAVRVLRSYRIWVVACACMQALSFLPLIAGALNGSIGLGWVAFATVSYWSFGMATNPAWNAWVTSLVPAAVRARFFAKRTRAAQAALFVAITSAGLLLHWGKSHGGTLRLFALLFGAALVARLVSALFLSRQSEAPNLAAGHRTLPPGAILHSVRAAGSARVLAYLLGMQAAVNVASSFFTSYMLGPLRLSYLEFMTLTAAAFAARILVMPLLGRVVQRRGTGLILWWGACGIVPLPVLWLVSNDFTYLLVLQVFAGSAWAALEFATLLSFFEHIADSDRASVLSAFNLANASAVALGALVGSQLHGGIEGSAESYFWLFVVSSAGRLAMLGVLRGTPTVKHAVELQLRTLAVRPSAGAVERPILATVGKNPDAAEEQPSERG